MVRHSRMRSRGFIGMRTAVAVAVSFAALLGFAIAVAGSASADQGGPTVAIFSVPSADYSTPLDQVSPMMAIQPAAGGSAYEWLILTSAIGTKAWVPTAWSGCCRIVRPTSKSA